MADPRSERAVTATRYARAIERRWCELLEEPVVLSRRDWSRIDRWFRLRIPLEIIRQAMDEAVGRDRPRGRTPRLADLSADVEQAWDVVREGHLAEAPPERVSQDPLERWRRSIAELDESTPLSELLETLLARRAAGEPAARLDEELDRKLPEAADRRLSEAIDREILRELALHRDRMDAAQLERTRRRVLVERLRRHHGLPRLAGASGPD